MRSLSIRQPWAWLVVNGYKDIENRTWNTSFRGRMYVHAGRRILPDDFPGQREHIRASGIVIPSELPRGAILGEVTVADCVRESDSPWFCGPYGFILTEPIAYARPITCRGQLGFFTPEQQDSFPERVLPGR